MCNDSWSRFPEDPPSHCTTYDTAGQRLAETASLRDLIICRFLLAFGKAGSNVEAIDCLKTENGVMSL